MVAYLTLVEKARDGGGAGGAGEWGRVYECLAEGWRGVLVREREGEGEESERRREEKRRDVEEEVRLISFPATGCDLYDPLVTYRIAN